MSDDDARQEVAEKIENILIRRLTGLGEEVLFEIGENSGHQSFVAFYLGTLMMRHGVKVLFAMRGGKSIDTLDIVQQVLEAIIQEFPQWREELRAHGTEDDGTNPREFSGRA